MPPTMGGPTEAGQGGPIVKVPAGANAAVRKLIGPDMFFKVKHRIQRGAGFEHENVQAAFGKHFRGGAAGCA